MKKLIFILITGLFFVSCNNNTTNTPDNIRKKLTRYKEQVAKLNEQIAKLEKQLEESENSKKVKNGLKVRVEKAHIQSFSEYFVATGELETDDEVFISPDVPGQIKNIYVEEGQRVKKGQLLARLNTSVIEENIKEVKTQLDFAQTMFDKQQKLWDQHIGSEQQYLDAKNKLQMLKNKLQTLKAQYDMSLVYAPVNGYVEEIYQKRGEQASPGVRMMQIVGLDKMKVTANISEAYLPVIHQGDTVEITFPTYPDLVLHKSISVVGHFVSKQNRTFKIQIYINNKNGLLKPNLLANVKINNYNSKNHIVIPSRVIREDMKGSYIYTAHQEGDRWIAQKKYITMGKSYRNKSEIVSGLEIGDLIITDGFNNVTDGTFLNVVK